MFTLTADGISDAISLPSERMIGEIKSIHRDYINISTTAGLITLVRYGMPHIPFGIEIGREWDWQMAQLGINQTVHYLADEIIIEGVLSITGLQSCHRFSCRPNISSISCEVDLLSRLEGLHQLCLTYRRNGGILTYLGSNQSEMFKMGKASSPEEFLQTIPRRFKQLVEGVVCYHAGLIGEGVLGLIGLGEGSTPSGDDFLLGFLSGITYTGYGNHHLSAEKMAYHMNGNAATLTTMLSAEYIRYGTKGFYHQRFSEMISSFRNGTEQELIEKAQQLMKLGHFSGGDLLLGFIYGGFTALSAVIAGDAMGGHQ